MSTPPALHDRKALPSPASPTPNPAKELLVPPEFTARTGRYQAHQPCTRPVESGPAASFRPSTHLYQEAAVLIMAAEGPRKPGSRALKGQGASPLGHRDKAA